MKKQEADDIVRYLRPLLEEAGVPLAHFRVDTSTDLTGQYRGDVWISREVYSSPKFESNIIALVEAKHRNCVMGDLDWRKAMSDGKSKAEKQGLNFYVITNCLDTHRFYNRFNDEEILLDGQYVTQFKPLEVLQKIQTQVNSDNSQVFHRTSQNLAVKSEAQFRRALQMLANVYRSCGLKQGDDRIDPTVGFVVLKYIQEKEDESRTLGRQVKLWHQYGQEAGINAYKSDFNSSRRDIFSGEYGKTYTDFSQLVNFPSNLQDEHYEQIHKSLSDFHFHGCNFDVFGAIYEEFATPAKKKQFGEFYTRRHITGIIARLLLRNEVRANSLRICDPACGTGGFLTEAFKALTENYTVHNRMNVSVRRALEQNTFWGFDNDEKSVARTKLNMFLAGDGHTHINRLADSLWNPDNNQSKTADEGNEGSEWYNEHGWEENAFDYLLANPPMGAYDGIANVSRFSFTNEKRYEMLFLEKIIKACKYGGEMAVVVPDGILEAPSRENFRQKLLGQCDVRAVVSLTKFAFAPYTKEKTYVLFLQKKQKEDVGVVQSTPIWHFIVDYDGYANSDKRYRTHAHDDLPELQEKFIGASNLLPLYSTHRAIFEEKRGLYERGVNEQEVKDGLSGSKCSFVEIETIGDGNFWNLLSEFHLRPMKPRTLSESEFDTAALDVFKELEKQLTRVHDWQNVFRHD